MILRFFKYISKLEKRKYPIYCGLQERRQFVCFLLTTLVELIYIPANILGLNDYHQSFALNVYNWVHLFLVVILQVTFWKDKISTRTSLFLWFMAISFKLSVESLYELFVFGISSSHILGNFNIILILAAVAVSVRISKFALLIMINLTVDLAVFCFMGSLDYVVSVMRIFFVGYMLVVFVILFDSKDSTRGLRLPRAITAEEKRAINMLINLNDNDKEKAFSLLSRLTDEQQAKMYENAMDYYQKKRIETYNLLAVCPSLTHSEIEICKLILQGKSIKEIASILSKSVSNITCQRTHIRRKLGLNKNEELKTTLLMKLDGIKER